MSAPKCQGCGASRPHVVSIPFVSNGREHIRHEWLCEDCEYRRDHPDALPAVAPPRERRPKRLQKEKLFDVDSAA